MSDDVLENTPENFQRLINETNDWKDKYLREAAESINIRNRSERDKKKSIKLANESFARDLLETLDNFERALDVKMKYSKLEGFILTQQSLQRTLNKHGVVECPLGTFDPNFHEAIGTVPGDVPNQIVEVHRKGYLLGDRLLRPTTVIVSK